MSVASGCAVQIGDEVTVAWRMADNEPPFHVLCIVRHIGEGQLGVEFRNLTLAERLRLSGYINQLDQTR